MMKTIKWLERKTWAPRTLGMPLPHLRKHEEEPTHGVPGREEIPLHRGGPGSTRCANNRRGGGVDSETEAVKACGQSATAG